MAMQPSNRHFCPTNSFFKLHGTSNIQFLWYSPSVPCRFHNSVSSYSFKEPNRSRKMNLSPGNKALSISASGKGISGYDYGIRLQNWSRTHKHNQQKHRKVVVNYQKAGSFSGLGFPGGDNSSRISDGGGSSTMEKIVEKLKKFGYTEDSDMIKDRGIEQERQIEKGSMEGIFYMEEGRFPNAGRGASEESSLGVVRFPWEKVSSKEKKGGEGEWTARSESRYSLAEMTLPESELRRLRNLTFQMKSKISIKGAGVTQVVVDAVYEKWKSSEIVRLKVEGACALNMRRMHEILERKTGGLVVWRSGTSISLYRGVSYEVPSVKLNKRIYKRGDASSSSSLSTSTVDPTDQQVHPSHSNRETGIVEKKGEKSLPEVEDYEEEVDKVLDGLGPRYTDWHGSNPLPVDADLLPASVPGYTPPFRLLPYGVRSTLGQKEGTSLRRLARVLPPHFALGRSRQLQGLATAMAKLWERSSIAKVALKRGVQLTTSERMAEELKRLTGGTVLSRNKDFLVFYRGKSFLSSEVAEALMEKERLAKSLQDEEEEARLRASSSLIAPPMEPHQGSAAAAGTLEETLDACGKWAKNLNDGNRANEVKQEVEKMRHAKLVRKLEMKLAFAERKLLKAERALAKVEVFLKPSEDGGDPGSITDEERFMFRKLGLKMKAFLLLGRRGVFDGTVENMHLHWKYRELVKILVKAKSFEGVKKVGSALEAESGGVLVSIDKVSKGYAVIVYRGKDYKRPSMLRPKNLLTKRKALARSIELQRREAMVKHIEGIHKRTEQLRAEIREMEVVEEKGGDEALYDKIEMTYASSEEDEDEDEEIYSRKKEGEEREIMEEGGQWETEDEDQWYSDELNS